MRSFLFCILCVCLAKHSVAQKMIRDQPFLLGRQLEIYSAILQENRILNIWLPEGYNEQDTTHYPVIYLLDGGADEDFIHVTGLVQFNNFEWINRVPKSIVVGIANTDRKRDFTFPTNIEEDKAQFPQTGGSANFIRFVESELQPLIAKQYRSTAQKTLIGQSLGGLLATEILLTHPQMFSHYIIISPSLWWNDGSLLDRIASSEEMRGDTIIRRVYIGVGDEGYSPGKYPHLMKKDARLLFRDLQNTWGDRLQLYFDYLPDENHATIAHQAIANAFRILYSVDETH